MLKVAWISGALIAGLPTIALAQNTPVEAKCENPQTLVDKDYCADRAWRVADEELNATYVWALDAAGDVSDVAVLALRDAQRAWIPFRDRDCEAESYLFDGGGMQPRVLMLCKAQLTRLRTEDIRATYGLH